MNEVCEHKILAYQDMIAALSELLAKNLSLSALYINCSHISKIEAVCGKKIYQDIIRKIQSVISEMRGDTIRNNDIIVSNNAGSEEFTIFLSPKRDEQDFCASDLETL
jgi:hypothetical protein